MTNRKSKKPKACPKCYGVCHDENGMSYKAMNSLSGDCITTCRRWLDAIEIDGVKLGEVAFFDDAVRTAVALVHQLADERTRGAALARINFHDVSQ